MSGSTKTDQDGWTTVVEKPKKQTNKQSTQQKNNFTPQNTEFQQWQTTTIHRKLTKKEKLEKDGVVILRNSRNKNVVNTRKIEKQADEEGDLIIHRVSSQLSKQIRDARMNYKNTDGTSMTQKQLAQLANLPVSVVQEYENGKAIPNHNQIASMSKVLKVQLKN
jgi:ribosome-binding protein aMBF1 (putative translation factor)